MKILIIKPSSLGDVIHAMPVVSDIKKNCPEAQIHWLVNTSFISLVESVKDVVKIISFDRASWNKTSDIISNLKALFKTIKEIRSVNYDVVIDLQGLLRSALFSFAAKSKRKLGFDNAREFSRFFYTDIVKVKDKNLHAIEQNRGMVKYLFPGYNFPEPEFNVLFKEEVVVSAEKLLEENKIKEPFCVFCPDARWPSKTWPVKSYLKLAELITIETNLSVIITADKNSSVKWEQCLSNNNLRIISLAGKTSLTQLACIFSKSLFVVGNDSGPIHLAVAVNTKVFAVMGPTNPKKTGPYLNSEIISSNWDCEPCYERNCRFSNDAGSCINEITPEKIIEKIKTKFKIFFKI